MSIAFESSKFNFINLFFYRKDIKFTLNDFNTFIDNMDTFKLYFNQFIHKIKHFADDPQIIFDILIKQKDPSYFLKQFLLPPKNFRIFTKKSSKKHLDSDYDDVKDDDYFYNDKLNLVNDKFDDEEEDDDDFYNDKLNLVNDKFDDEELEYFEKVNKTVFIPKILSFSIENDYIKLFDMVFERINDLSYLDDKLYEEIKTNLFNSIYDKRFYFFDKLKKFHPLLLNKKQEKVTPFGNVRNVKIAKKILKC